MGSRLKPNAPDIEIVDGPFAGKRYVAGVLYEAIPPQEAHRFDEVTPAPAASPQKTKTKTGGETS